MIHTELTRQLNSTTRDRKQINLYFSIEAVENYKNIDCLGGAYCYGLAVVVPFCILFVDLSMHCSSSISSSLVDIL